RPARRLFPGARTSKQSWPSSRMMTTSSPFRAASRSSSRRCLASGTATLVMARLLVDSRRHSRRDPLVDVGPGLAVGLVDRVEAVGGADINRRQGFCYQLGDTSEPKLAFEKPRHRGLIGGV